MKSPKLETTPAARRERHKARPAPWPPLKNVLAVAAGGAIGATMRYSFILAFPPDPGNLPLVILLENIIGAFLLGLVLTLILERWRLNWDIRPFLTTGILGSFTTFSNLALDIVLLTSEGEVAGALGYAVASVTLGMVSALLGVLIAKTLIGERW